MPSAAREEAARVLAICNACRYCEGFCAVFPALELRRTFSAGDLTYLANLCHDCRGCYYACPYAPPHEFAVNVPLALSELRTEAYVETAWPRVLAGSFRRNGLAVGVATAVGVALVLLLVLFLQEPSQVVATHVGEGAFYAVIPYGLMVLPALAIGAYALTALVVTGVRFWRGMGGTGSSRLDAAAVLRAVGDAARLRYLEGGGHGCNYPDERFSSARKWLHHLVLYGFLLDLAATTVAAIYHHFLQWDAPYPFWSLPVVLGTVGGVGLLVGAAGLLWLKRRSNSQLADQRGLSMDVGFLWLLFLTSLSGLALLAFRETVLMGVLLAVHLGIVAGLFLTLPYGKFVHVVHRSAALVRYAMERSRI